MRTRSLRTVDSRHLGAEGIGALLRALKPRGTWSLPGPGGDGRSSRPDSSPLLRQRVSGPSREVKLEDLAEARQSRSPGEAEIRHRPRLVLPEAPEAMARADLRQARGRLVIHVFEPLRVFVSDLQYVIKESGTAPSTAVHSARRRVLFSTFQERTRPSALRSLRAAALHRSFDHEFRSMLSAFDRREHFVEDWPYTLGAIRAHSGDESKSTFGHGAPQNWQSRNLRNRGS